MAFQECRSLQINHFGNSTGGALTEIDNNITYIDVDAFHYGNNSVNLTEIFIHNSISHLGMGCFENYGRMDGFTINDGSGLINSENYSTYFGVRNAPTITGIDSH